MFNAIRDRVFPTVLLAAFLMGSAWTMAAFAVRAPDEVIIAPARFDKLTVHPAR